MYESIIRHRQCSYGRSTIARIAETSNARSSRTRVVAIISERLKTRFCVFYDGEYTLDAFRFALPRERTVDLGQYVLLTNDALCEGGTVW